MKILGIESSCDETAAAVVQDGECILSNVVATQIPFHKKYNGVVPEIAGRKHIEWILPVVKQALSDANLTLSDIDAFAAVNRPGLMGALLVGTTFAKTLAFTCDKPFLAINHLEAHLYASSLHTPSEEPKKKPQYPYIGLLVSGGHTIIALIKDFNEIEVLGTTIDDAIGETFDKVSKFYGLGYPGGAVIDKLAAKGNPKAAQFPMPNLKGDHHRYDVSYSGLKTGAINQCNQFWNGEYEQNTENLAAAFQYAACKILVDKLLLACADYSINTVVVGGGVAANSALRAMLTSREDINFIFPPLNLCGDNAAQVAGVAYQRLMNGERSSPDTTALPRITEFRHETNRQLRQKNSDKTGKN